MADERDDREDGAPVRKVSPTQANNPQAQPRTFAGGETFQSQKRIPVVLYGGAFDPPTLAHEAAVLTLSKIAERVVIVPSGPRSDKAYKVCEKSRLRVLEIFASRFVGANVELDTDFLSGELGETTTLGMDEHYSVKFGVRPYQAFGSDTVPNMAVWDPSLEVLERLPKVLFVRHGYEVDLSVAKNFVLADIEADHGVRSVSSTEVRAAISAGRMPEGLAPEILSHIFEAGLYGAPLAA